MIRSVVATAAVLLAGVSIAECTSSPLTAGPGTASAYCAAVANYVIACNVTDPCALAASEQCLATAASSYSPVALGAFTLCLDGTSCGDAGGAAWGACSAYWTAVAAPTDAQAKLAQDYCAACPTAAEMTAQCVSTFYANVDDAGAVVATGAGYPLLPRTDKVVASAGSKCVPKIVDGGAPGCATFAACELEVLSGAIPALPAACTPDAASMDASADAGPG